MLAFDSTAAIINLFLRIMWCPLLFQTRKELQQKFPEAESKCQTKYSWSCKTATVRYIQWESSDWKLFISTRTKIYSLVWHPPTVQHLHHSLAHLQNHEECLFGSNSSSLFDTLIDFKSVLDAILLLQHLWDSWKPAGETSLYCTFYPKHIKHTHALPKHSWRDTAIKTTMTFKPAEKITFYNVNWIPIKFVYFLQLLQRSYFLQVQTYLVEKTEKVWPKLVNISVYWTISTQFNLQNKTILIHCWFVSIISDHLTSFLVHLISLFHSKVSAKCLIMNLNHPQKVVLTCVLILLWQ